MRKSREFSKMKASTWRLIIAGLLASAAVVKAADEFNCPKGQFWRNDDYNPSSEPRMRMRMLFVTKHFSNLNFDISQSLARLILNV